FDYCSVHVSTVSSHSAFWFSSSSHWLNGVTQYCSRNLCGFAYRNTYIVNIVDLHWFSDTSHKSGSACCHQCVWYFCRIRNHVDKYVITKHYYQLMPLSLATYDFSVTLSLKRKGSY
ncbi:hypothetical protein T02_7663, partial [Trichinella nativa]